MSQLHTPIVQKLVDYFSENPEFCAAFNQSFALAYATGIEEFKTFNIQNVDDYIRYMDEYVHWIPTETTTGTSVYLHLCLFYFILDLPPVREHQSPIDPTAQSPWRWLSEWLIEYAQEMGKWMDSPESITDKSVATFSSAENYHMEDYPVPEYGWKTFNEFFARYIDPAKRPIASETDDTVIVNAADCVFDGSWPVNEDSADITSFDVKGVPWTISQLLDDTELGPAFAGGVFTHSFLNANDYHRQHAPVSGTIVQAKVIPGLCYLDVVLTVDSTTGRSAKPRLGMHRHIRMKKDSDDTVIPISQALESSSGPIAPSAPGIDAPDTPGYQFIQARGLILIDNPKLGLVAVLPIGMAQVSSVVLSVKPGDVVNKGEEISCFQFGGSDIVMVFQKNANVTFNQEKGTHYNFGDAVATASPSK